MISIFLPTRYRLPFCLPRAIESIVYNSSSKENFEIIFGVDNDDQYTLSFLKQLPKDINYQIVSLDPPGYKRLYIYFDKMSEIAKGDFFWLFPDDVEILTRNWDLEILNKKDEMYLYASLGPTYDSWPYSLIPIISNRWYHATSRISGNAQADCWLGCIAYDLDIVTKINVVCNLFMMSDGSKHDTENLATIHREEHLKDKKMILDYTKSTDNGKMLGFV